MIHTERPHGYDAKAGGEGRTVRDNITEEPCTRVQPMQPLRRNQVGLVVCYYCGQPEHFARRCFQPRHTALQEAPKNNNPVEMNAPPTFLINKLFVVM